MPNIKDNEYYKYSGIAFQLCAIIGLCVWIGFELDEWLKLKIPWFTILGTFMGVILMIAFLYQKLTSNKQ